MKYFIRNPTVNCTSGVPSLVYVEGRYLVFNETKARFLGIPIDQCRYALLTMRKGSDHYVELPLKWSPPFTDRTEFPPSYENILSECTLDKTVVGQTFITIIKRRESTEEKCNVRLKRHLEKNSPKETMSVLLVGIDGISKNNLERSLPKTKKFILNEMGALELNKMNKAGDNTLPNMAAFLSGSTMNQLRENFTMSEEYFDKVDHKFIWKEYSDAGYRVGAIFDRAIGTAFHYQKKGWNKSVFDYYHRPVVAKSDKDRVARRASEFCIGQEPTVTHLFDFWLQLATVFNNSNTQPYFGYSFFCHLTHDDPNLASAGDELYLDFFQNLKRRNVLNNTILVFFSDHGARFGPFRLSYAGLLETRNPMMFFIFPPWFKKKYPRVMKTFNTNRNQMTTFFDAHATLRDILHFKGEPKVGNVSEKGISLFKEIPKNRTCSLAGISMNYCLCTHRANIQAPRHLWAVIGERLTEEIVERTDHLRDKCHPLKLVRVKTVVALKDDRNRTHVEFFRAIIETTPGGAVYEGLVEHSLITKKVRVKTQTTNTRLNLYRGQAECIESEMLRPFCACRNLVSVPTTTPATR